jgi:hypothetical protein
LSLRHVRRFAAAHFPAAGFAEFAQRIALAPRLALMELGKGQVGRKIGLDDLVYAPFGSGDHPIGGHQPDPIHYRDYLHYGLRAVQLVPERIDLQPRGFGDEFGIQQLALVRLLARTLLTAGIFLADPGGCQRRVRVNGGRLRVRR